MCEFIGEIEIGFTEEEGSRLDSLHFTEMGRTSDFLSSGWEGTWSALSLLSSCGQPEGG